MSVSGIVYSLEESELSGIQSGSRVNGISHILDSHMGMTDNIAARELLRSGVVCCIGVGEGSSNQPRHLHSYIKGRVGLDVSAAG